MGTDAAVSGREPLIERSYHADGSTTTNGIVRVRKELLAALYEQGLLDRSAGSYQLVSSGNNGTKVHYQICVLASGRTFHAEAPACLGEVTMHVHEV
jgi:hypothetical protein